MSRTRISIIHCDNCSETISEEEAWEDEGRRGWFRLQFIGAHEYDYCSCKCLFAHAGMTANEEPTGGAA